VSGKWFANRGQAVQVTCAVVGATVSLLVWLSVPPSQVLYLAPVLFVVCALWLVYLILTQLGAISARRAIPIYAATPDIEPAAPPLSRPYAPSITKVKMKVLLGAYWECKIGDHEYRVAIHGIQAGTKIEDGEQLRADVEVVKGTGHLHGGTRTTRVGAVRYWMPQSRAYDGESSTIFKFDTAGPLATLFTLRVDHINPHAKEVDLEMIIARGRIEEVVG
jgi:hypothetical protein